MVQDLSNATGAGVDPEAQAILSSYGDIDYLFRGTIAVNTVTGQTQPSIDPITGKQVSNVVGDFTLTMVLLDHHHGEVVHQASTSWSGTINGEDGSKAASALATSFGDLRQILAEYESIPEEATVEPEYDPALAGEAMDIDLKDILGQAGQAKPWWRIFVKAEQGQVLNGEPKAEYKWFRVGQGSVSIRYRAPESCQGNEVTETITVMNTCNLQESFVGVPEREIATKHFKVLCSSYELEYEETYSWDFGFLQITIPFRGSVPFHAIRSPSDSSQILLEGGGEVRAPVQGQVGGACTFGGEMVETFKIGGTLKPRKDAPPILNLQIDESEGGDAAAHCPGGVTIPFTYMEPRSYPVEMMGKEGVIYKVDVPYGQGTLMLTLHQK